MRSRPAMVQRRGNKNAGAAVLLIATVLAGCGAGNSGTLDVVTPPTDARRDGSGDSTVVTDTPQPMGETGTDVTTPPTDMGTPPTDVMVVDDVVGPGMDEGPVGPDAAVRDDGPDSAGMPCTGSGNVTCGVGECRRSMPACVGGVMQNCTPLPSSPEVCDGLDNDCNGMIDDGLSTTTCGVGECARTVNNCTMGSPTTCTPGRPRPETCDGLDNDCDGMVDEDLGTSTCGMGACERTVNNCEAGRPQSCTAGTPRAETCNGRDDNCDGTVDEGLGQTSCGIGACRATVGNCTGGMPTECTPGMPVTEVCNNRDDNCDGAVDEGLGSLTCGVGACQRTVEACVGGSPRTCVPGMPSVEICDGLDNNCDGMTDEGNPGGGAACPTMLPGVCATGTLTCTGGRIQCIPTTMPGAMMEQCNGRDDNCDGNVDEGDPQGGDTCMTGAQGECSAGTRHCQMGMLRCVQNSTNGPSTMELCNGRDDNCNGMVDEGFNPVTCGQGVCQRTVSSCGGGMTMACTPNTAAMRAETCDGMDNDCNGTVDNDPPGGVICPAMGSGVGSTRCRNAGCEIASCAGGRYDVDGTYTNGCECQDDGSSQSCGAPTGLGTINQGGTASSSGNRPFVATGGDDGDWYSVNFPVGGNVNRGPGTPRIRLTTGAGTFKIDVRVNGCAAASRLPAGCTSTEWSFVDNASPGYTNRAVGWPSTVYIRVYREGAGQSCAGYTLTVDRP